MADNIMDVGPVDMNVGYGDPGAAGFFGIQKELLRRQALARQAQLDEEARQKDMLDAQVKQENIASLKTQREGQAQLNKEKADALAQKQFETSHGAGAELSPEEQQVALRLYGPSAVQTTPGVAQQLIPAQAAQEAQPAVTGVPDEQGVGGGHPAVEAKPAVPETLIAPKAAKTTFSGSEDQRQKKSAQDLAHGILNGEYDTGDDDVNQEFKGWALSTLMTGKATSLPAGSLHPKTQADKDSTRYFNTRAAQRIGKPVTPEEAAFADAYEKIHPTEATKQRDIIIRMDKSQDFQSTQRTSREFFSVKNKFRNDLADEAKKLQPDLERVDRAQKVLASPNFLADAIAAPEVLQIMAGGMGSGLRMTDAELNRVNAAQTKLDQIRGKLAKWDILPGQEKVTIQADMRKQMTDLVNVVQQARQRHDSLIQDTLLELEDAKSEPDVDQLRSGFFGKRSAAAKLDQPAAKASSGLPAGVTVTKNK
jgi:hypothetical protein